MTRDGSERRARPGLRMAALGVGLVGAGVVAAVLWSAANAARAQQATWARGALFSAFIADLPIMPGLAEDGGGYAVDLHQGGRLAEARLAGEADAAVVRGFYAATLAQLGWRSSDADPYVYHRGDERLIFLLEQRRAGGGRPRKGLEAVFVVSPATPV